jgi:predicted O-methyltransferase YrrM
MDEQRFADVDRHLDEVFGGPDPILTAALERSEQAGLPPIAVSANIGRLLHVLALARGARRVLEIGTLGGYSTIWMARALPSNGLLVTLEYEPRHADVARQNIDAADVRVPVEIRVGPALESLQHLIEVQTDPFDLVFIDADKPPYVDYLDAAVRLSAPGTLIVVDNVVQGGAIADGPTDDPRVDGVQRFNAAVAAHPGVRAAAVLQVVGTKAYDGLAFAVVDDPQAVRANS